MEKKHWRLTEMSLSTTRKHIARNQAKLQAIHDIEICLLKLGVIRFKDTPLYYKLKQYWGIRI